MPYREQDRAVTGPAKSADQAGAARAIPAPSPDRHALFVALVSCLDVERLEDTALKALAGRLPRVTALARIGSEPNPSRVWTGRSSRAWKPGEKAPPILAYPIGAPGQKLGFIGYVYDEALVAVLPDAQARLVELAPLLVVPARNALRYAAALELAYRDPLTGLCNRRALWDHLEREQRRCARHGRALALLMFDLDRLKDINDCWGHDTGDRALCALAGALEKVVRRGDIVARLGGDEFAVVLPDAHAHEARRIGARVQQNLAARKVPCGADMALAELSACFGVSDIAESGGDLTRMIELADAELFAAKRSRGAGHNEALAARSAAARKAALVLEAPR